MNDRVFLDSNILVYSYSNSEPAKQSIAHGLIETNNSYISTQVLQELTNTITRKFEISWSAAQSAIEEFCRNNNLHVNTEETILQACQISKSYRFSFYDSLIISAALEIGCSTLYSEDMQNGQLMKAD
jgi:predicted nucleic acid-binding protein